MKTKYIINLLLLMIFTLSSCREITIKTKVNNDGSFTRIISLVGDSSEVIKKGLPYPIDDSWDQKLERDSLDSAKFVCTYTKTFRNDEELNDQINADTSWRAQIDREVEISKRFMFFYSFITYREVYKATDPGKLINYKDYMSPEDMDWVTGDRLPLNGQDSIKKDLADEKAERYLLDAIAAECMLALERGIDQLNDPVLQKTELTMYKDSIDKYAPDWCDTPELFIDTLAYWSGNERFRELHKISPSPFKELLVKIEFIDNLTLMEGYRVEAEMPGLITGTNSTLLVGNTVGWNIQFLSFYFDDYEMYAESRVVNYWAFILSGAVVLLLLIALVVKLFR